MEFTYSADPLYIYPLAHCVMAEFSVVLATHVQTYVVKLARWFDP